MEAKRERGGCATGRALPSGRRPLHIANGKEYQKHGRGRTSSKLAEDASRRAPRVPLSLTSIARYTLAQVPLLQVYLNESLLFTISAPSKSATPPLPIEVSLTPYGDVVPSLSLCQYVSLPPGGVLSVKVDVEEEEFCEEAGREVAWDRPMQGFLQLVKL